MLSGWGPALVFACNVLFQLAFAAVVLVRGPKNPSSRLAWVLVVLMLPIVGVALYLMLGEVRLGTRRIARHSEIVNRTRAKLSQFGGSGRYPALPDNYRPLATLAEVVGQTGPRGGNELRLISETEDFIAALAGDIDAARLHCNLLFYIYLPDASGRCVADALMRAAQRGVACRLLVDGVGSVDFLNSEMRAQLERAGVKVVEALPASLVRAAFARIDLRNHRKIAVIDGNIGFTGSQNIADAAFAPKRRFAPWVDAAIRIRGPAVRDLSELFIADWFLDSDESIEDQLATPAPELEGGIPVQIIGTGPGSYNAALLQLIQAAVHLAREELILTTPYFVPDAATASALGTAALRGVSTHVVVPARNDSPLVAAASRGYYSDLLSAGVHIHEYTEGLLHAKTLTLDREFALISTANLDRRSFDLNFEVSSLVFDSDFASHLRFLQRSYMEDSRLLDPLRWKNRSWRRRLIENAAGTMSPLL